MIRPSETSYLPTDAADRLDALLIELTATYRDLVRTCREHRRALASANLPALGPCVERMAGLARQIERLDAQRRQLVGSLSASLWPDAPRPGQAAPADADGPAAHRTPDVSSAPAPHPDTPSLRDIAQAIGGRSGQRLLRRASRLRRLVELAARRTSALAEASSALSRHVDGLVAQVLRRLGGDPTYSPQGMRGQVSLVSGLDLTH